ncbi:MAG: TetR/AcrR family transcriptional regulator [Actinomycetes bacterium]
MTKNSENPTSTRDRILDAGIDLWRDQPPAILFGGLTVARVSEAAHVTRSTFYSYWPSSEEYVNDLAIHLAQRDAMNYPEIVNASGRAPYPPVSSTDIARTIISDCAAHLEAAIADPTLSARLGFLSKADDPSIAEALQKLYRASEDAQFLPLSKSMEMWGRVFREPFDEATIKIVFSSLFDGLASRFRVEPERFPHEIYGWVTLPLIIMLTRNPDDGRDLIEICDSVNSFSAVGLTSKLREKEILSATFNPQISRESMRDVTVSIRRLQARIGFGELSMSEIAGVTGYSEVTLHQMFGSRPGIALCVLFLNTFERAQDNPDDVRGLQRIRQLLSINFDEMRRNPVLGQNVMMLLSGHTAVPRLDLIDFDPRPQFDAAVTEAIDCGQLHRHLDAKQLSIVLQRTMLIEGSRIGSSTESIDTIELILQGAGAEPVDALTGSESP